MPKKTTASRCICLFYKTNGTVNGVRGTDRVVVSMDDLTSPFEASKCTTLSGKPKLVFIQASRGELLMNNKVTESQTVADHADFLMAYSTVQGYTGARNNRDVSYFIKSLTRILDMHGNQRDFLSCLSMIKREVSLF